MKLSVTPTSLPGLNTHARLNVKWKTVFKALGLLVVFIALGAVIQFASPNLTGNDDYFHIRFSQVMRQTGLVPHFPWLPLTILNPDDFYDHHFLYHMLLMPFTFGDLTVGAKWSAIIFSSLAFLMGWVVLRGQQVPYAALWALGLFAISEAFLYRLSMTRVQAVSLFMLLLMLHITLQKKHFWLLPLAFIYTWLYDAFPLLLAVIGIYVIVTLLFERQFEPAPLLYAGIGVGLGLLINPYFPNNLVFVYRHYLPKIIDIADADISVGSEWYPYQTWSLVKNSGPALIAFAGGALALGLRDRRMDTTTAMLFFTALFFGALLLKSRRFIEYFPAFVLIFCAVAWSPLLKKWQQRTRAAPLILAILLIPTIVFNIQKTQENIKDGNPPQEYEAAAAWLKKNSAPGSRLFQTDWDDFSRLYFHNTHNTYTLGLDPTYMYLQNPALYSQWRDTTQGWGNIGLVIKETFGAGYAITDREHYGFIDKADMDPYLRRVYEDEYAIIFEVLTSPDPDKKSWYTVQ